jgi:hypothetical protein
VKPLPETPAPFTVTASVPVEERVIVCDAVVFTATFPNERLDVLTLNAGVIVGCEPGPAANCKANVSEIPPEFAVSVTVCEELTEETVALNAALVARAATITVPGTVTEALLLARLAVIPAAGAAPLSVTVQLSVAGPISEPLAQLKELKVGVLVAVPIPLRPTTVIPPLEALLVIANWPVDAPAAVGEKLTLKLYVPPAASVIGRLSVPFSENDCPATLTVVICTATEPSFTIATFELAVCPRDTAPKLTLPGVASRVPEAEAVFAPLIVAPPQPQSTMGSQHEKIRMRESTRLYLDRG